MPCKTVPGAAYLHRSVDVSCSGFIVIVPGQRGASRGWDRSICLLTVDFPARKLPKEAAAHDKG